jgi:hypothetical protein
MFTVHVRVTEQPSGKPVPARLRLHAAGRDIAPLGRSPTTDEPGALLLADGQHYHVDGGCEARLPAGSVEAWLSRGPEYRPEQRELPLAHGQMSLRLSLERVFDWRERGWYPGDCRAHGLSPHAALLEGRAEGLSVVHLLAREQPGKQASNLLAFSGTQPCLPHDDCLVAVNTLNEHSVLGTVALLNSHRPVFPLRAGAPDVEEWSVRDWCGQCHRKKGLVVWPDLPRLTPDAPQGEALACLLLGEIDAYEVGPDAKLDGPAMTWYYRLLGCGVRAALVGASGKDSASVALGAMRTYALCPDGLSLPGWVDAVRQRRTFVTNGPLLDFSVRDGKVRAEAHAVAPFERFEVVDGGEVVASTSGNELEVPFVPEQTTWVAARCVGATGFAHTSPVWVEVAGRPWRIKADDIAPVRELLDATHAWAERLPEKGRAALRETVAAAVARLEGPRG